MWIFYKGVTNRNIVALDDEQILRVRRFIFGAFHFYLTTQ